MIKKLLIANRGEIACRIMKTARRLGIHTVAIYSTVDHTAQHVKMADSAYCVGDAPSAASYLSRQKIIGIAQQAQADAIHPGYGFLAEDAEFAALCEKSHLIFVGPQAQTIKAMGDKQFAKTTLGQAGISVIPGYLGHAQDTNTLLKAAQEIGLPLLIKAVAGGGGKGMRLVTAMADLTSALESAQREAKAAFLDDRLLLEKYLNHARHIEVQLLADHHGHTLHLGTRDCSIQRRHQKIIEEAPAPNLHEKTYQGLTATAIHIAKNIGYHGAGTIEFLVDQQQNFYFMEMNTRLQVEHPVTEIISGLDLVEWQLRIASGEPLPWQQTDIVFTGHAIEARLYAEDPANDFLPSCGRLDYFKLPPQDKNLRIDNGVIQGDNISPYYDPLLAKLIVFGDNRESTLLQLQQALTNTYIIGINNNIALLHRLSQHTDFIHVKTDSQWLDQQPKTLLKTPQPDETRLMIFAVFLWQQQQLCRQKNLFDSEDLFSPWNTTRREQLLTILPSTFTLWIDRHPFTLEIMCALTQVQFTGQLPQLTAVTRSSNYPINFIFSQQQWHAFISGEHYQISATDPHNDYLSNSPHANHGLTAPMPGTLVKLFVKLEQTVQAGDKLAIMEAMKMEHILYAPHDGTVMAIHYQPGERISEGSELFILK